MPGLKLDNPVIALAILSIGDLAPREKHFVTIYMDARYRMRDHLICHGRTDVLRAG